MNITRPPIEGLLIIEPQIFQDNRGYFYESYNQNSFSQLGIHDIFVQDNQSCSKKGVVRGLHFQLPPYAMSKLVRVVRGAVLDVAVDLRKDSSTYGKHFSVTLSEENHKQFYIPAGFAHGFVVLEDDTIFAYKCSHFYHKLSEVTLRFDDPVLQIDWGVKNPVITEKDRQGILFNDFISPF